MAPTPRIQWPERAAQYLRMSREHQRYSPLNQAAAIAKYADVHGLRIVRTYRDEGRSGLTLRGRKGLQHLLQDILGGSAEFGHVLVLDVSRWGRFQDPDQAAHYEFLCREAGVRLHYCDEGFGDDGDMVSGLLKHLKRVMAAEYSRELGGKVWAGQASSFARGNKQGGAAPFGMRRQLIAEDGGARRTLKRGQMKALQADRVVLVHGPPEETLAVRKIFGWFVRERASVREIARRLIAEGFQFADRPPLTSPQIGAILRNEIYVGSYCWNRTHQRLRRGIRKNPRTDWHTQRMVEPLVSRRLFAAAQARLKKREPIYSDEALISHLRALHTQYGEVTFAHLRACRRPSVALFYHRFGSLAAALELAGCQRAIQQRQVDSEVRRPKAELVRRLADLLHREGYLSAQLIDAEPTLPSASHVRIRFGNLVTAYRSAGWDVEEGEVRALANVRRWRRTRASTAAPQQLRQDIDHGD